MALDLGELVGSLRLDTAPFNLATAAAEARATAAGKKIKDDLDVKAKAKVDVDVNEEALDKWRTKFDESKKDAVSDLAELGASVGTLMTKAGAAGPLILAVGSSLSAMAAGGVQVMAAVGPAAAAGLVVYAGGLLAVKAAAVVTEFAMQGVMDAAGGDKDAFDKLSPAGQKLATTLKGLTPELDDIRTRLQSGMFAGFDAALERSAGTYLPMAKQAATQYGDVLGNLADKASKTADTPFFQRAIGDIIDGNAKTTNRAGDAAIRLSDAAVQLFASAQPLINAFFRWADGAARTIDKTVTAANESGRLADFWDKAARRGSTLWGILSNLGQALGHVFSIGAADSEGGKLLKTLERGSVEFNKWTQSADGVQRISHWFSEGRDNLSAMWRLISTVSGGLSDLGSGAQLAPLIDQITNEVIPPLMDFLGNASASGALGSLVSAVGSVIQVFADLSENDRSLYAFADTLNMLAQGAQFVTENVPGASTALGALFTALGVGAALRLAGLGGILNLVGSGLGILATKLLIAAGAQTTETGAITVGTAVRGIQTGVLGTWIGVKALEAAAWTRSAAAATAASVRTAAAWVMSSAAATASAVRTAAAWALSSGAAMASAVAATATAVATTVAGWVVMGAQSLAQAARVAAAWLIAMGPIGIAVAAVVAVGILIYKNWDNIKKWTGEAWSWVVGFIKDHVTLIVTVVTGPIGLLVLQVIRHWDDIKKGTSAAWGAIVDFVKGIPGKLLSFFLNWTIVGQFVKHWDQMKTGAISKATALVSWVSGLPGRLLGALGDLGGMLLSRGQQMIAGLQQGASNRIGAVVGWVQGIPGKITGAIPNPLGILSGIGADIIAGLKNGISGAAHLVEDAVQAIINKIPAKIRHMMGISSPSKVMRALAQWIPAGLALGMADGSQGVENAITTLTDKINAQFEKDTSATEKNIRSKYAAIAKHIKATMDGKAEQRALRKNEDNEADAIKAADKAERLKNKAVLDLIKAQAPAIRANAAAQDDVTKRLDEQSGILANMRQQALDYAASVRDSFNSFGSISSLAGGSNDFTSIDDLIAKREAAAKKADDFAAAINALRGKLNENDLQDLVAKGPEALTVAQGIAAGGDEAIAKLNELQARMQASGQSLGDNVANTLYAAGIAGQQALVDGLTGDLSALEAAAVTMGNALLAAISKAMEGVGDAIGAGVDAGTKGGKGGKGHKGGKRLAYDIATGAREGLGIRSPSTVFRAIGGHVVDGMILGLAGKGRALEAKVGDVMDMVTGAGTAALDVGLTASAAPARVPESAEVRAWSQAQGGTGKGNTFNIYETTNPQATAAEVSRRQAFAGAAG